MTTSLQRVCMIGTGSFLPNDPVPNDQIDDVLGQLTEAPEKVRQFIRTVGWRMLENGGVKTRHFAINPETHTLTHSITTLAEQAALRALDMAGLKATDIDLLLLSSSSYDTATPPTSTLLQERLGIDHCAEMEVHSNCAGVGKCMQIAHDALRLGHYKTALIVYSQLSSAYLRACYFNQPRMNKTQATLRYILADGSGAAVLQARPNNGEPRLAGEIVGTYVESIGGRLRPAMTAGGGVQDIMNGLNPAAAIYERGTHHLDQDFFAVNRDAAPFLLQGVVHMLEKLQIDPELINHYIWSIPTMQLYDGHVDKLCERLKATPEQMKFRATECGYCGGAAILIHLDQMVRGGELHRGQRAVLHSVESSKWMSAGFVLDW
jgi:3-oxoacyl-[acyl-carrier-protein] synthase III